MSSKFRLGDSKDLQKRALHTLSTKSRLGDSKDEIMELDVVSQIRANRLADIRDRGILKSNEVFANKRSHVIITLLELFKLLGDPKSRPPDFISNMTRLWPHFKVVYCQLFKKNQITGVREIHILDIISRLFTKVRENIARRICEGDVREMLTSGKKKISFIKARMKRSITQAPANIKPWVYHYSEDMTRWAQQFIIPSFNLTLAPFCLEFGEVYAWNTQRIHTLWGTQANAGNRICHWRLLTYAHTLVG